MSAYKKNGKRVDTVRDLDMMPLMSDGFLEFVERGQVDGYNHAENERSMQEVMLKQEVRALRDKVKKQQEQLAVYELNILEYRDTNRKLSAELNKHKVALDQYMNKNNYLERVLEETHRRHMTHQNQELQAKTAVKAKVKLDACVNALALSGCRIDIIGFDEVHKKLLSLGVPEMRIYSWKVPSNAVIKDINNSNLVIIDSRADDIFKEYTTRMAGYFGVEVIVTNTRSVEDILYKAFNAIYCPE